MFAYADVSVTASQTDTIDNVTVASFNKSGTQIGSNTVGVNDTLVGGQTRSEPGEGTPPFGAATCQVVSWSGG